EDVVQSLARQNDGFCLMLVQLKRPSAPFRSLAYPEDATALGVKNALSDQLLYAASGLKRRVKLNERLRPEQALPETLIDGLLYLLVTDLDETRNVGGVVLDEPIAEFEDVHLLTFGGNSAISSARGRALLSSFAFWMRACTGVLRPLSYLRNRGLEKDSVA